MWRDHRRQAGYEEIFVAFSNIVERWLRRLLVTLLAALLLFQALLQLPAARYLLTDVEKWEGVSPNYDDGWDE